MKTFLKKVRYKIIVYSILETTTNKLKNKKIITLGDSNNQTNRSHISMIKSSEKLTLFENNKVNYDRINNDDDKINNHEAN